jgi:hypothetical protein
MGKFWVFTFPNEFGGIFTWPGQAGNYADSCSAFQLLLIRTFALALRQVWQIPHLQHLQQLFQATCGILTLRPGARTLPLLPEVKTQTILSQHIDFFSREV